MYTQTVTSAPLQFVKINTHFQYTCVLKLIKTLSAKNQKIVHNMSNLCIVDGGQLDRLALRRRLLIGIACVEGSLAGGAEGPSEPFVEHVESKHSDREHDYKANDKRNHDRVEGFLRGGGGRFYRGGGGGGFTSPNGVEKHLRATIVCEIVVKFVHTTGITEKLA